MFTERINTTRLLTGLLAIGMAASTLAIASIAMTHPGAPPIAEARTSGSMEGDMAQNAQACPHRIDGSAGATLRDAVCPETLDAGSAHLARS